MTVNTDMNSPSKKAEPSATTDPVTFNRTRLSKSEWSKLPTLIKAKYLVCEKPTGRTAEWTETAARRVRARTAHGLRSAGGGANKSSDPSLQLNTSTSSRRVTSAIVIRERKSFDPSTYHLGTTNLDGSRNGSTLNLVDPRAPATRPTTPRRAVFGGHSGVDAELFGRAARDGGSNDDFQDEADMGTILVPRGKKSKKHAKAVDELTKCVTNMMLHTPASSNPTSTLLNVPGSIHSRSGAWSAPVTGHSARGNLSAQRIHSTRTRLTAWKDEMVSQLVERQPSALTAIVLKEVVARPLSSYVTKSERHVRMDDDERWRLHVLVCRANEAIGE